MEMHCQKAIILHWHTTDSSSSSQPMSGLRSLVLVDEGIEVGYTHRLLLWLHSLKETTPILFLGKAGMNQVYISSTSTHITHFGGNRETREIGTPSEPSTLRPEYLI